MGCPGVPWDPPVLWGSQSFGVPRGPLIPQDPCVFLSPSPLDPAGPITPKTYTVLPCGGIGVSLGARGGVPGVAVPR